MLDSPARIFRCPICVRNHIKAQPEDLTLLIEHIAKHLQFFLYECQRCQTRFATPFLANYHIKEGKCSRSSNGSDRNGEGQVLRHVRLNDVDFKAFCDLQNEITKCIKETISSNANAVVFDEASKIKIKLPESVKNYKVKNISASVTRNRTHSPPKSESPVSPEPSPSRKRSRDTEKFDFSELCEVPEFSDRPVPTNFKAKISVDCLNALIGEEPVRHNAHATPYIPTSCRRKQNNGTFMTPPMQAATSFVHRGRGPHWQNCMRDRGNLYQFMPYAVNPTMLPERNSTINDNTK